MARKSKSSSSGTRDSSLSLTTSLRSRPQRLYADLSKVHDFPLSDLYEPVRPARLFSGVTATVGVADTPKKKNGRSQVPFRLAFQAPSETVVCVRRSRRKEVLFAKGKAGKRGQRRPRRSAWSDIKC